MHTLVAEIGKQLEFVFKTQSWIAIICTEPP